MHSEERTIIGWLGTKQRTDNCIALCGVIDYASHLLSERSREDIARGKPWWWSFRRRHVQELQVSIITAREPDQSALMCEDFARYFRDVVDTLSKCDSPRQILNLNGSGVTARPFNGKK
jgi:hypothetical protein